MVKVLQMVRQHYDRRYCRKVFHVSFSYFILIYYLTLSFFNYVIACQLSFEYNYNINSNLKVYIHIPDQSINQVLIWESNYLDLKPNFWNSISVTLRHIRKSYQLLFVAQGNSSDEYQAIGGIRMHQCGPKKPTPNCEAFQCENKVCINNYLVCDYEDDCGDGSDESDQLCKSLMSQDFENGFGDWGQTNNHGWQLKKAITMQDLRNGPTIDHTTNYLPVGSYLFSRNETIDSNIESMIDSPPFMANQNNKQCQIVFYVLQNSINSTLFIRLQNLISGNITLLDYISEVHYVFKRQSFFIPFDSDAIYKIQFISVMNVTTDQFVVPYIAIDDVTFSNGCLKFNGNLPTTTTKRYSTTKSPICETIKCANSNGKIICVEPNELCNFVNDCADGADEKNCGDCNFNDRNMCGWTNVDIDQNWFALKPAFLAQEPMLNFDADNNEKGGYATIRAATNEKKYVSLESPRINIRTSFECKFQFSYFTIDGSNIKMYVHDPTNPSDSSLLLVYGNGVNVNHWKMVELDLRRRKPPFTILIQADPFAKYDIVRDIGMDSFKFVNCFPSINQTTTTTPSPKNESKMLDCDFETDLCGWMVGVPKGQQSNWYRVDDSTVEPGNDHTSLILPKRRKSGTWLATQANRHMDENSEIDYLISQNPIKPEKTYCFTFWYYFYGVDYDNSLALYLSVSGMVPNNGRGDLRLWWEMNVPKLLGWTHQSIELSNQSIPFYLMFVAYSTPTSSIGLDDIQLIDGKCYKVNPEFCDMENLNQCDWKIKNGWTRRMGKISDHTYNSEIGSYLLSKNDINQTSIMTKSVVSIPSQWHETYESFCLRFYYYMNTIVEDDIIGDNETSIQIKIMNSQSVIEHQNISIYDVFDYGQLMKWTLFSFSFKSKIQNNIQIDGKVFNSNSMLAIDDISITSGSCGVDGSCDFENGKFHTFCCI